MTGPISWVLVGNFVYALAQWAIIISIGRIGGASDVGIFGLALAIVTPLYVFTNLQLRTLLITDVKQKSTLSDYFFIRILSLVLTFFFVAFISIALLDSVGANVTLLLAASKTFEFLSDMVYADWQKKMMFKEIAISMILRAHISVSLMVVVYYISNDIVYSVIGLLLGTGLVTSLYDFSILTRRYKISVVGAVKKLIAKLYSKPVRKLVVKALPLGFVVLMISLQTNIPRYLIHILKGEQMLGVFISLFYPLMLGGLAVNAASQVITTKLAVMRADGEIEKINNLVFKSVYLAVLVSIFLMILLSLFGQQFIVLVYGDEYSAFGYEFLLLFIAVTIDYVSSFFGNAVNTTRRFNDYIIPYIYSTMGVLILSAMLIPFWGMAGAAVSILLANIFKCFSIYALYSKHFR